jgi:tRNA(Glu) U13 pseudouridine synthase TruD
MVTPRHIAVWRTKGGKQQHPVVTAFGLKVQGRPLAYGSVNRLEMAHRISASGYKPEIEVQQGRLDRKIGAGKYYIDCFVRQSVSGFHSWYKETPSSFRLWEVDAYGTQVKGRAGTYSASAEVQMLAGSSEQLLLTGVQEMAPRSNEHGRLLPEACDKLRRAVATLCGKPAEAQPTLVPATDSGATTYFDAASLLNSLNEAGMKGTASTQSAPTSSEFFEAEMELATVHRLFLELNRINADDTAKATDRVATVVYWSALPLSQATDLSSYIDESASDVTGQPPAILLPSTKVKATFYVKTSPELHRLKRNLNADYANRIWQFFVRIGCEQIAEARSSSATQLSTSSPQLLKIPFVEERIIRLVHKTGIILPAGEDFEKEYMRKDIRHTTEAQKEQILLDCRTLADTILCGGFMEAAGDEAVSMERTTVQHRPPAITVVGTHDELCIHVVRAAPSQLPATSASTTVATNPTPTNDSGSVNQLELRPSNLPTPPTTGEPLSVPITLQVIEVVFEKVGLPHDQCIEEIQEWLKQIRWNRVKRQLPSRRNRRGTLEETWEASLTSSSALAIAEACWCEEHIPLWISTTAVTESSSHSTQRMRIRGSCLQDVQQLIAMLNSGRYGELRAEAEEDPTSMFTKRSPSQTKLDGGRSNVVFDFKRKSTGQRKQQGVGDHIGPKARVNRFGGDRKLHRTEKFQLVDGQLKPVDDLRKEVKDAALYHYFRLSNPTVVHESSIALSTHTMVPRVKFDVQCKKAIRQLLDHSREFDLKVGALAGFAYEIHLSAIQPTTTQSQISAAIRSVSDYGFLNYFGPQRFGTYAQSRALPGAHLLRGEFRAAANLLVQTAQSKDFRDVDPDKMQGPLRELALRLRAIGDENSGVGEEACRHALLSQLGIVYCKRLVFEFCSFAWNEILTARVKRFGSFAILPGDVILPRSSNTDPLRKAPRSRYDPHKALQEFNPRSAPRLVTEEEVRSKQFSPFDVLLPVPGSSILLPENDTRDIYCRVLESYGFPLHPETNRFEVFNGDSVIFDDDVKSAAQRDGALHVGGDLQAVAVGAIQRRVHSNALGIRFPGAYRTALGRPLDLRWSLDAVTPAHSGLSGSATRSEQYEALAAKGVTWANEKERILKLQFRLPPSQYCGMLLRELTKFDVNSPERSKILEAKQDEMQPLGWRELTTTDRKNYMDHLARDRGKRVASGRALYLAQVFHNILSSGKPLLVDRKKRGQHYWFRHG